MARDRVSTMTEEQLAVLRRQLRLQTIWFIAIALIVLLTAGIAIYAVLTASSGKGACDYQRSIYPASHKFRLDVKDFMHQTYITQASEAKIFRDFAAQTSDPRTGAVLRALADHDARAAARARKAWKDIQILRPPTCS